MTDPRSFILRIYRRESGQVSGVVEDPQTGSRRPFSSARELWKLVAPRDAGLRTDSATGRSSKPQRKESKP
jgi:hypothetical protein